jgi:hypothetical protein
MDCAARELRGTAPGGSPGRLRTRAEGPEHPRREVAERERTNEQRERAVSWLDLSGERKRRGCAGFLATVLPVHRPGSLGCKSTLISVWSRDHLSWGGSSMRGLHQHAFRVKV